LDAGNNDNLDFGGNQLAADFDNNANQINFKTPGSTTSQFNGEYWNYLLEFLFIRVTHVAANLQAFDLPTVPQWF